MERRVCKTSAFRIVVALTACAAVATGCGAFTGAFRPSDEMQPLYSSWFKEVARRAWEDGKEADSFILRDLAWARRMDEMRGENTGASANDLTLARGAGFVSDPENGAFAKLKRTVAEPQLTQAQLQAHGDLPSLSQGSRVVRQDRAGVQALYAALAQHCAKVHEQALHSIDSGFYNDTYKSIKAIDANGCIAERNLLWLLLRISETSPGP